MNITNDIKPITLLKSPALIQDLESMRNSIGILKLMSQGEDDIKQGNVKSQEQVFNDIEGILLKRFTQHII